MARASAKRDMVPLTPAEAEAVDQFLEARRNLETKSQWVTGIERDLLFAANDAAYAYLWQVANHDRDKVTNMLRHAKVFRED